MSPTRRLTSHALSSCMLAIFAGHVATKGEFLMLSSLQMILIYRLSSHILTNSREEKIKDRHLTFYNLKTFKTFVQWRRCRIGFELTFSWCIWMIFYLLILKSSKYDVLYAYTDKRSKKFAGQMVEEGEICDDLWFRRSLAWAGRAECDVCSVMWASVECDVRQNARQEGMLSAELSACTWRPAAARDGTIL